MNTENVHIHEYEIKIDERIDKAIEKMNKISAMLRGVKMQVNLWWCNQLPLRTIFVIFYIKIIYMWVYIMQYEIINLYEIMWMCKFTKFYNLITIINTYIFIHEHTMYIYPYELITKL